MRRFSALMVAAVSGLCVTAFASRTQAQVGVSIGFAPACPYGYYDAVPYSCAPFGYYGPEWFRGRVFIGAGPWFHGPRHFQGYVNNGLHPEHGYSGPVPNPGERWDRSNHLDRAHFQGNEQRDGRGHLVEHGHQNH